MSELREWAAKQDELCTSIRLSSVARDLMFNLICQVVNRVKSSSFKFFLKVVSVGIDQDNYRAYLGVWDGTKTNM